MKSLHFEKLDIIGKMKHCPVDPDLKLVKDLLDRESDPHVYRCISSPPLLSEIHHTPEILSLFINIKKPGSATIIPSVTK
jgi:enhancing lycopene biosynthesis protein 2